MIKMVVTDIDGTILGKNLKLSDKIKNCFHKLAQNNIKAVLATGRMYRATTFIAEELQVTDPIISYQGGFIKMPPPNGQTLREILLPRELTLKIVDEIKKKNIHTNLYTNDTLFVEQDNELIKKYCVERAIPYKCVDNFEEISFSGVHKLLAIDNDPQKITDLINYLTGRYSNRAYITHSTPYFCEVSDLQATKGAAVEFLANMWNIQKDEIAAFGDQDNDIELLQSAGLKIAMGNATEGLKNKADYVCDTVENDGFAKAVEEYVLRG